MVRIACPFPPLLPSFGATGATVAIILGAHTVHVGTRSAVNNDKHMTTLYYNNTANRGIQYMIVGGVVAPSISNNIHDIFDIYDRVNTDLEDFDIKCLTYLDDAIIFYCLG
ncbi:hypothetical protein TraAM80_00451 [Trypanosoma rangeli]|uniref:Uncharacterized protein n=1 Tax=Trypanosoma rangeli TaxID=5698 RepID=A0A422P361_TRYRA|nr:uncharacterized protein TraAM80_00451 [Trypanosoma rangeli]RNF12170.1 hypothetical protein TraAM80_00451 [Trypanosoma rangeli]|eukprot:RNF12170.1 hypothetical protein TraAM80_00451 [Trypanosoma rangeli]